MLLLHESTYFPNFYADCSLLSAFRQRPKRFLDPVWGSGMDEIGGNEMGGKRKTRSEVGAEEAVLIRLVQPRGSPY